MAENEKKRGRGAPRKTDIKLKVPFSPGQVEWLDDLVAQLYGRSREAIIEKWVTEQLNKLCEEGRLRRPAGSMPEPSLVPLENEKDLQGSEMGSQLKNEKP